MIKKRSHQKLFSKLAPKKVLEGNAKALKFYDYYKKTSDIIEKVNIALGRKMTFKINNISTLNFRINHHGTSSITEEKV
jgi:hypothetical protein